MVLPLLLGGAAVAGVVGFFVLRKKTLTSSEGTTFAQDPAFTGGLPNAEGLDPGTCVVAVQGQAGFSVGEGVPPGENTILRVLASPGAFGTTVVAVSTDPRVTPPGKTFTVPTRALSGGGDCAIV